MSNIKALVVDDSSTSRILLTKILKKMDIHCEQACSGEDAISQLSWFHPDFIFLDHLMPGMDGFETLKKIKESEQTKHIPVIMYTSQHAHTYYEEAHKLGAAGVISKQIDRDKLYLMLNRLCFNTQNDIDVPTVFNELQSGLSYQIENDTHNAKLFARISTLETAYEELHDENRMLRLELTQFRVQQDELQQKSHHFSGPQLILAAFLAVSLFGSTFSWFTTQKIEQGYQETQIRLHQVNDVIDEIIGLLEKPASN